MSIKNSILPLGTLLASACGQLPGEDRPNILYVFPDQFRNCAMSFWNDPEYEGVQHWKADPVYTPNLNAFAKEALVLSRAMSTCPLSSPYRGMFLTGMYPERSGIQSNCMALRPDNTLSPSAECISDVLRDNGYTCGYIGKLHAEVPMKNDPARPGCFVSDRNPEWDAYTPPERRHGFSYWYSYGTFDEHKNPHYWDTEGVRHDPKEFSVKHETDKAIDFLRGKNGERDLKKPFFLCVAYNPPHSPYSGPEDCIAEDYARYADLSYKRLYVRENADTTLPKAPSARYYFANITAVDREFGRILRELKSLGLEKNTIVVFTSDHGETLCSHATEDPKNAIWTESFNVPFLIRYPGHLAHRVEDLLFSSTDIMPTLLSLAGLSAKIPASVEGHDYAEVLAGRSDAIPESALYLRNVNGLADADGLIHDFHPQARGIRTDRYTMEVVIDEDRNLQSINIYDDVEDPYQLHNLPYTEHLELTARLLGILQDKLEESNDIWHREAILNKLLKNLNLF